MTTIQINDLLQHFPHSCGKPELIETHISWVILCRDFVYKIKKPITYSFLDYSTLPKRHFCCNKEVELNKRLTEDIYLDVQPVTQSPGGIVIGNKDGEIIDYAVRMRKVDRNRQMDVLLQKNKVTPADIKKLAQKIAAFHNNTTVIYQKELSSIVAMFNDIEGEKEFLQSNLSGNSGAIIDLAIEASNAFMGQNKKMLYDRLQGRYFRDCHGDLHSRNIFLLSKPQPFDCIEFNDDYRQIDVLNETAFLCMDLEASGRHDLASLFMQCYNQLFPAMNIAEEFKLFVYYKSYRANIRAKVNSLRARDTNNEEVKRGVLKEADKYLHLMDSYIKQL